MTISSLGMTIANWVEMVRQSRAAVADLEALYRANREQFDALNAPLVEQIAEARASRDGAEANLRALAVAHFATTGEKRPHPAVTIREGKPRDMVDDYDEETALAYAIEKGVALTVDCTTLENYLRAVPSPMRPHWFVVRTETPAPTAAIAREIPAPEDEEMTV